MGKVRMVDTKFKQGDVTECEISKVWTRDPLDRKTTRREFRWPEYIEFGGHDEDGSYTRFVCKVVEVLSETPDTKYNNGLRKVKIFLMTDEEIMATEFKHHVVSGYRFPDVQAKLFAKNGYEGPVPGGTARGLVNAFNALGRPECVRRGYFDKIRIDMSWGYPRQRSKRTYCYVFKSPRADVKLNDFVRLARAYRDGKGLRKAIQAVIDADGSDFKQTLETLTTLDTLAGLGE
jgi:hypothetical protein